MAGNTLSQARAIAVEGFLRYICEFDLCDGPHESDFYFRGEDFIPSEPSWLRQKLHEKLPKRLDALWKEPA